MSKNYDYLFKIVMIGDSAVGKTSVLTRFANNNFSQSFIATIGIDFTMRTIELNGKKVKLQVWDTAGQERFRTITTAYYRGAMGIVLVYDVTDAESFDNIRTWISNIDQHASSDVEKLLLANKCDLVDERAVSVERGEKFAADNQMRFYECSAKTGQGVQEAFTQIARDIKAKLDRRNDESAGASGVAAGAGRGGGNSSKRRFLIGRLRRPGGGGGNGGGHKIKCSLL
ncbi:hypothetical protein BOX15_Mlig011637g1 [Macrostomum lignano]|uniref:Ras-related protein Rab-13 n=1 Tax=Macrostomum lignano TaxID=282301 RepID=A0A267EU45_9PLAT|nr:hypothetical protein BOX15_Mlig011637g1 [Macrostomum lignano]